MPSLFQEFCPKHVYGFTASRTISFPTSHHRTTLLPFPVGQLLILLLIFLPAQGSLPLLAAPFRVAVQEIQSEDPFAEPPLERTPEEMFRAGDYQLATEAALKLDQQNERYDAVEGHTLLAIRSQLELGNYQKALEIHQAAMAKFPLSIRHRWLGAEVYRYNNDQAKAESLLNEIEEQVRRASWRYRDLDNQLLLVEFMLDQKVDAKEILDKVLKPLQQKYPRTAAVFQTVGNLALSKADYDLAARNFQKACEIDPLDPDAFLGLAAAYRPSDWNQASEALQKSLSLNPRHVDSLLMLIDQHISAENYPVAQKLLQEVQQVNPDHPVAWAYLAVLAHLNSQFQEEGQAREHALLHWPGNPEVDHIIGRELSEKYRFLEGSQYQRRSLKYQNDYLPAKMQLAHDLLRLGQELEGWQLAEQVFDEDQYSVVAHNLLTLKDNLSQFQTLQHNGFVVRMDRQEAELYGDYVLELLAEAEATLVDKYQAKLQKPIFIEVFPRQQDFAIRTFGLPGGNGYLGVCFGRLITMNSPAAQGSSLTSWRSVLWHEFCHVVTLQKTANKMPRWLSEGISVYEEGRRDPAWGQNINPTFQKFLLGEELTPVSQLSGAFLSPKSAMHVQFAYYESSLVVAYLVEKFGRQALVDILEELETGMPINDALSRHAAPIAFLDKDFSRHARELAGQFAPDASFKMPETDLPDDDQQWEKFHQQNPNNVPALLTQARQYVQQQRYEDALPLLEKTLTLAPEISNEARQLQALCYRELKQWDQEELTLVDLSQRTSDSVETLTRLLQIYSDKKDWPQVTHYADRLIGLNPLIAIPHQSLAEAAKVTGKIEQQARALKAVAQLDPVDPAAVYFQLAQTMAKLGRKSDARRYVLISLEHAPRFREAHQLLLDLVGTVPLQDAPPRPSAGPLSSLPTSNVDNDLNSGERP